MRERDQVPDPVGEPGSAQPEPGQHDHSHPSRPGEPQSAQREPNRPDHSNLSRPGEPQSAQRDSARPDHSESSRPGPSPSNQHQPTARQRVVLAERRGARRVHTRIEVAEQTEIGEALIGGLIRAQLGLALRLALLTVAVLASLPVLFALGSLGSLAILGIRLPWLLLGVAAYPLLFGVGWLYVRLAERNEQDFLHLAED